MHAGIPILASKLPEIKTIIDKYDIGAFIDNHNPQHIANQISEIINNSNYNVYKNNTKQAAIENNWLTEKQKLIKLIQEVS